MTKRYTYVREGFAGENVNTNQKLFLKGEFSAQAYRTYAFEGALLLSKPAGSMVHNVQTLFAGSAIITAIQYAALVRAGGSGAFASILTPTQEGFINTAAPTPVTGNLGTPVQNLSIMLKGLISIGTAGSIIPQYALSTPPGGAYTTQPGSWFYFEDIGPADFTSDSLWN